MTKEIRLLTKSDFKEIQLLFEKESHGKYKRDQEYLNWFYNELYRGDFKIAGCFFDDQLIGCFSVVKKKLSVFDEVVPVGHTLHAVISKDFQDKVYIFEISKFLFKEIKNTNWCSLLYGLPNQNFFKIQQKIDRYQLVKHIPMVKASSDFKITDFELEKLDPSELNLIEYSNPEEDRIYFIKDFYYFSKRYFENPEYDYDLMMLNYDNKKSYFITKKYKIEKQLRLHIVEFININHDLSVVYSSLCQKFESMNLYQWDKEESFKEEKEIFSISNFCLKNLSLDQEKFNLLLNYKNWDLQMGDSDVF